MRDSDSGLVQRAFVTSSAVLPYVVSIQISRTFGSLRERHAHTEDTERNTETRTETRKHTHGTVERNEGEPCSGRAETQQYESRDIAYHGTRFLQLPQPMSAAHGSLFKFHTLRRQLGNDRGEHGWRRGAPFVDFAHFTPAAGR